MKEMTFRASIYVDYKIKPKDRRKPSFCQILRKIRALLHTIDGLDIVTVTEFEPLINNPQVSWNRTPFQNKDKEYLEELQMNIPSKGANND